ncbi:hypothetical protein NDU88_000215 [Pleurodeles waltl]|uniref:Uncharacterized protein n=1 Tax=Pleurodeles waltl TaxID=8319 RepID=A0AAV7R820_PLEWA|nr:hypothetical protein NDU88_000215 [Pleurodeles waltl]
MWAPSLLLCSGPQTFGSLCGYRPCSCARDLRLLVLSVGTAIAPVPGTSDSWFSLLALPLLLCPGPQTLGSLYGHRPCSCARDLRLLVLSVGTAIVPVPGTSDSWFSLWALPSFLCPGPQTLGSLCGHCHCSCARDLRLLVLSVGTVPAPVPRTSDSWFSMWAPSLLLCSGPQTFGSLCGYRPCSCARDLRLLVLSVGTAIAPVPGTSDSWFSLLALPLLLCPGPQTLGSLYGHRPCSCARDLRLLVLSVGTAIVPVPGTSDSWFSLWALPSFLIYAARHARKRLRGTLEDGYHATLPGSACLEEYWIAVRPVWEAFWGSASVMREVPAYPGVSSLRSPSLECKECPPGVTEERPTGVSTRNDRGATDRSVNQE